MIPWKKNIVNSIEIIKSTTWMNKNKKFADIQYCSLRSNTYHCEEIVDDVNTDMMSNSRYSFSNAENNTEVSLNI